MTNISDGGYVLGALAGLIGGSLGAYNNGAPVWKGLMICIAPSTFIFAILSAGINVSLIYQFIIGVLIFISLGCLLGIPRRAIVATLVGNVIFTGVAAYFLAPILDRIS